MEKVVIKDNVKEYYINGKLSLTITQLEDNNFIVENTINKIVGSCSSINEYKTKVVIKELYTKGKNGRLYKTKKLLQHNVTWFGYILEKEGYIHNPKSN